VELGPFTLQEGFDFCITRRSGLSSAAVGLSGERASVVSGVGVEPGTGASSRLKASCFTEGGRNTPPMHTDTMVPPTYEVQAKNMSSFVTVVG